MREPGPPAHGEPVLLWSLGERHFAVPLDAVLEVTPVAALTEGGVGDGARIGYLDLRGASLPAFDARRLLGLDEPPVALSDRYLIVRVGAHAAALLVNGVEGIAAAREEPTAPDDAEPTGIRLARLHDDGDLGLVHLVDLDALLPASA